MRAGGCTVQQALTPEAATIVKQAVQLARRRGHAQVNPLHVATSMLSSSTGLLRAACLQSHSHPLQCKALELCFNVALNRLPASSSAVASSPILGGGHYHHHHHTPPLNNALVAAFKRAQAHQRRGTIDNQQQPLLAVKIELEQLVISILDDPSVSRVMREAGFSSTQVKSNVEQAVSSSSSSEMCVSTPSSSPRMAKETVDFFAPSQSSKTRPSVQVKNEDVMCVIESLGRRRKRSLVIIGECLATMEGVVRGVMDRIDHKEEVPDALRNVNFISLSLSSFRNMSREEVDEKVGELKCFLKSCCVGREVVLYLGDLKWAAEYRASCGERGRSYYCAMDHILMELRNMVFGGVRGEDKSRRFWLLGIATYQTFMKCRIGHPSLGSLWDLQPLTMPSGSLNLGLNFDCSQPNSNITGVGSARSLVEDVVRSQLSSCGDCSVSFEKQITSYSSQISKASTLPSWLQQYKQENLRASDDPEGCLQLKDLCRNWNTTCNSAPTCQLHPSELTFNFSSASPSSSISSYDQRDTNLHQNQQPWLLPIESKREHQFLISEATDRGFEQHSRNNAQELLCAKLTSSPNLASSSNRTEMEHVSKFKELNAENLKVLCIAMERSVAWQHNIIPEIASTILQCRAGMLRRKEKSNSAETKEETWLFFQGGDNEGKERIARELANLIFGSHSKFVPIGLNTFSLTRSDSSDGTRNKRSREEASRSYVERLFEAIRENPHRVFLIEDMEQVDARTQVGIKSAIERGKIKSCSGEEVCVNDAIIILSCESFDCRSRACSPPVKHKTESEGEEEEAYEKEVGACSLSFDLNQCAEGENMDDFYSGDVKLLELVDRAFFFKLPEDL